MYTSESIIGNLNDSTIEDLWNSSIMKRLRVNHLSGTEDVLCNGCYATEAAGLNSFRVNFLKGNSKQLTELQATIDCTENDGKCPNVNLEYWDFRFSNLCNYKCRTCGIHSSSAWNADWSKLNNVPSAPNVITWGKDNEDRLSHCAAHIHSVKEIYFAGGEPLVTEEHYQVLELLKQHNRTDVKLRYNTNVSTLTYKQTDLLNDHWVNFNRVEISVSLDAIEEQAEYIRSGTKWATVAHNISRLVAASNKGNITLLFNVSISALNIMYIVELFNFLVKVGAIGNPQNSYKFLFNVVHSPDYYFIGNLPQSAKNEISDIFTKADEVIETQGYAVPFFTKLFPVLNQKIDYDKIRTFKKVTLELDSIRNECISETLPELWKHYSDSPHLN